MNHYHYIKTIIVELSMDALNFCIPHLLEIFVYLQEYIKHEDHVFGRVREGTIINNLMPQCVEVPTPAAL